MQMEVTDSIAVNQVVLLARVRYAIHPNSSHYREWLIKNRVAQASIVYLNETK